MPDHDAWTPDALPDQTGRTVVVTGGSAGIGYFIAEQLAGANARVVLAARNPQRSDAARDAILARHPLAEVLTLPLDIASLASIAETGARIAELGRVDGLVLNAAVMRASAGEATADGFDPIMGTGHLGNAALIAAALPTLERTAGSRIVGTTSGLVRSIHPRIPPLESVSRPLASGRALAVGRRYVLSKAAHEALFAELDRRLRAVASPTAALLSHPGMAVDSRTPERAGAFEHRRGERLREPLWGLLGVGKDAAARSAVRATIDPQAEGGQYWGPLGRIGGPPVPGAGDPRYTEPALGSRIWQETEQLIGSPVLPARAGS
ncbi:short subunit dehydrogenase [Compostimonas suwonensis]|uniref:Short subunit dehydrogenase n=2 Tax=Compostimonas suwonensis TaxID=1048394 RepID=A0A2M9BBH8_9MICO|nr:short subunit dehydrogenase [Compostimonas suwonensis]